MTSFLAKEFFDLSKCSIKNLWKEDEPVWSALLLLESFFQSLSFQIDIKIPPAVHLDNPEQISIGQGTIIEPNVYIQGPCVIGQNCVVRHGAYLRGQVICQNNCVIGHASEIKHSILLDGAQIAHLSYVGDSIIGNQVNLGAGVKCANLRLDRREIAIRFQGEKIRTGLKKFGCVIGDGCQIGCNTVINPGTLIGPKSVSYPLVNLHGVIAARTRIKNKKSELDLAPIETAILEWLR